MSEIPGSDFTTKPDVLRIVALSVVVGAISAGIALGLLKLIGFFTNLVYYGQVSSTLVSPDRNHLGIAAVGIPVVGALVVTLMARFGSERIRGHGIPEAMETILVGGSTVEPRLAILKPVSAAISIGTGGPFGAEGPIIMTGGAFGSLIAQLFKLSSMERRALLVAGSCAGMAAVFGTPVAAALFGVELLVFELRPRTMVPIGIASAVADILRNVFVRYGLMHAAPLFAVPHHGNFAGPVVAEAAVVGLAGGLAAWLLTKCVYGAEDLFKKLPIHWMWWPLIGGLVIGIGGLIEPRALGVGYDTIDAELIGHIAAGTLLAIFVVKLVIWSVGLGSGMSGGILAPLLIMGAAMGGAMSPLLAGGSHATWALLGMAAAMAGVTRSPFTSVIFAFELTRDTGSLLPLLLACTVAHLVSVLLLKRSILTEKVARRGFHVVREYGPDPLEALFVRDVMHDSAITVDGDQEIAEVRRLLEGNADHGRQRLYPVVDGERMLIGALTWTALLDGGPGSARVRDVMTTEMVVAHPLETLVEVADRMADHKVGVLPVVSPGDRPRLEGLVGVFELLAARERKLADERTRTRVLHLRPLLGSLRPGALPDVTDSITLEE